MMITVSLGTAKKMKESGFNADALLCREYIIPAEKYSCQLSMTDYTEEPYQEARTAQEILDELPKELDIETQEVSNYGKIKVERSTDNYFYVGYRSRHIDRRMFTSDNIAEALAKLWLRCKENGYLSS